MNLLAASALHDVWHAAADPWASGILRNAFLETWTLGVVGGVLGCWVVLYGLSYSAESLSHAMFPGLVLAALAGIAFLPGGAAAVLVAAGLISLAGRVPQLGRDNAVAVVVSAMFGAGVLLAISPASPPGLESLLFGDVLAVSSIALLQTVVLAAVVLGALWLLHDRLLLVGFDRHTAGTMGASPLLADAVVLFLLAITVIESAQAVGTLLAPAVLIGPAATARRLARRMTPMMALASGIALAAATGGLYLSYYAGTAAGASIAGCIVLAYLIVSVAARTRRSDR